MTFLTENIGTILTGLVLLGIVSAIILKIRRDRKKNKCAGCSFNCTARSCSLEISDPR
ncbi:MAG: FeoB-associated Cys-rich membrane protein [Treponema sp.]|nr:FeoB-associated Cys-rich membrane protein [Treponema sp.]